MAWSCSGRTNKELIENLFRNGLIKSPVVKAAMEKVSSPTFLASLFPRRLALINEAYFLYWNIRIVDADVFGMQ